MVRLKDISPDKNGNGIIFQFHYGTIKSIANRIQRIT